MPLEPKAIDPKHLADVERDLPGIGQGYNTGNLSARYHKDVTALLQDRKRLTLLLDGKPFPIENQAAQAASPAGQQPQLDSSNRVCKALEERNEELRKKIEQLTDEYLELNNKHDRLEQENVQLRKDIDELVKEETSKGSGMEEL